MKRLLFTIILSFAAICTSAQPKPFKKQDTDKSSPTYGLYGYVDSLQKWVITPQYNTAYSFKGNLAVIKIHNKWGFINTYGEVVIHPEYDDAWSFSEGMAAVKKDDKWGFIDTSGILVIPYRFDSADFFENGEAYLYENGRLVSITKKGVATSTSGYEHD